MDQTPATSISLAQEGYRSGLLYWGIIAVVVVVFLVTTITYWLGTLRVIDENTRTGTGIQRAMQAP